MVWDVGGAPPRRHLRPQTGLWGERSRWRIGPQAAVGMGPLRNQRWGLRRGLTDGKVQPPWYTQVEVSARC